VIRADGQQSDFRREAASDFLEAVEVGAVAGMINPAALMFEHESAVAAMMIVQRACAPVLAWRERDLPILVRKLFPPLQFNHALEPKVAAPDPRRPTASRRSSDAANGGALACGKLVEVRMRQQHEINRRQMFDLETRTLDPFQQEKPVREVRINQDVQVIELNQKRSVADPGEGDFDFASTSERQAVYARRCAASARLFQTISRKKVPGLKCFEGVNP